MFIVVEGGIELSVKDKAGQKIVLHTPTAGEFFGELSLLDGGSRTATATAVEASLLYVLDREDMLQLFRKRPEAGLDMLGAMGRMTRKANALLQARISRNVNEAADSKLSVANIAARAGWLSKDGKPNKSMAQRCLARLKSTKLIRKTRAGNWSLTEAGKQELEDTK